MPAAADGTANAFVVRRRRAPLAVALGVLLALVVLSAWWGLRSGDTASYVLSLLVAVALGVAAVSIVADLAAGRCPITG